MTTPTTIIIPGIAAILERFLRPLSATAGEGIEIRQDERGTTVSACEGRHAATITTAAAGSLEPILVDPTAIADADPSQPLKIYRLTETSGAMLRADGELSTITIRPGTLSRSARDLADTIEGEIASGMTRAVFELDPRHLLAVAEALVATGAETVKIACAPRWNVLAAMAETDNIAATFLVAGATIASPAATTTEPDPLDFTIAGKSKTAGVRRRHAPPEPLTIPDDIPF
jgi:hypothetical protein